MHSGLKVLILVIFLFAVGVSVFFFFRLNGLILAVDQTGQLQVAVIAFVTLVGIILISLVLQNMKEDQRKEKGQL